jgi:hypothetical protein
MATAAGDEDEYSWDVRRWRGRIAAIRTKKSKRLAKARGPPEGDWKELLKCAIAAPAKALPSSPVRRFSLCLLKASNGRWTPARWALGIERAGRLGRAEPSVVLTWRWQK